MNSYIFLISYLGIATILLQITHMVMGVAGNSISKLEILQEHFNFKEERDALRTKRIYQSIKTVLISLFSIILLIIDMFIIIVLPIISFMKLL